LRFQLRHGDEFVAAAQDFHDPGMAPGPGGDGLPRVETMRAAVLVAFRRAAPLFHGRCALRARGRDLNFHKCTTLPPYGGCGDVGFSMRFLHEDRIAGSKGAWISGGGEMQPRDGRGWRK
jgi:hypothetical protein